MEQNKKRVRATNFTSSEVRLLAEIVVKYQPIIDNKKTDAATNKEKEETWNKIAQIFNSSSGEIARTAKTLKSKYETMKKLNKKKLAMLEYNTTCGDSSTGHDIYELEDKVFTMSSNIFGLDESNDSGSITYAEPHKIIKPNKPSEMSKTDELNEARLQLIHLQMKIAKREHAFVREEHKIKMLHLQNDEIRKEQIHQLMINTMQQNN